MIAGTETNEFPESLEQSDLALIQREIRRWPGQNRPFAERRPNGRFSIAASVKALSFWLRHATFLLHVVVHWPMLPHGALASLRGWRMTAS